MVGLESSSVSSGQSSPQPDLTLDEVEGPAASLSPPTTSSESGSRRPSIASEAKDESYREKRKRNNDAAKKSREKRRLNDLAMEQRLLELTRENNLLKSRLVSREADQPPPSTPIGPPRSSTSVIVAGPSAPTPPQPPTLPGVFPDPLYSFDFNHAAMAAAAAAAAFKTGSDPTSSLLFAAATGQLPANLAFGMLPQMPQPPPPCPSLLSRTSTLPTPFMSSRSAFQPFNLNSSRPSVVEMVPAPPKASATVPAELPESSGIHSLSAVAPSPPRPSIFKHNPSGPTMSSTGPMMSSMGSSLSSSGPSMISAGSSLSSAGSSMPSTGPSTSMHFTLPPILGSHIQFINQLPLAHEPRQTIFAHAMPETTHTRPTTATVMQPVAPQLQPSILGSLLSSTSSSSARLSPTVPQSRTEQLANEKSGPAATPASPPSDSSSSDLKANLSSLAVHLHANNSSAMSTTSTSSLRDFSHGKSDSESLGSPHSTRSCSDELSHGSPRSVEEATSSGMHAAGSAKGQPGEGDPPLADAAPNEARRSGKIKGGGHDLERYRSKRSQQLEVENGELRQEMLKLNNELEQLKAIIAANNHRLLPP